MQTKTYRGQLPKPTAKGDWRPEVGGKRFTVGNRMTVSEGEALRRLNAIRDLFEQQCERHGSDEWQDWLLGYAKRLASGDKSVEWEVSQYAKEDLESPSGDDDVAIEAMLLDELSVLGFEVKSDAPEVLSQGRKKAKQWLDKRIEDAVTKAIEKVKRESRERFGPVAANITQRVEAPEGFETKTLHQAIKDYSSHLEKTGDKDQQGRLKNGVHKKLDRLRYLRDHHEDLPLWKLNLTVLEEQAAYWRNRPSTQKTERCSAHFAKDMNKVLRQFLVWLDHSDFDWHAPRHFHEIKRSPIQLPSDERDEPFQTITKDVYSPEELAVLLRHTDDFGKVLIATCVNCAFGQSEIGKWPMKMYSLHTAHPHADKVRITSTSQDSWVTGRRPKTGCYGEHLLWPEVADALLKFQDGREVLPITSTRKPWYRTHSKNAQSEFSNWLEDLLDRVIETTPNFRRLPFGSFRDNLPNEIRIHYSDEVAQFCLQHKTPSTDDLLKCYANVPYRKVFEATKELHGYFKPMLDELASS